MDGQTSINPFRHLRLSLLICLYVVYFVMLMILFSFSSQVINKGSRDAVAKLSILAEAVTYTSFCCGECQREAISITVPAHKSL